MTREEVLALAPGRELDALVAEKVMGWEYKDAIYSWGEVLRPSQWIKPNGWPVDRVSCYSTDISAAWEVVEEMGDCLHLKQHGEQGEWEAWFCGYPNSKAHGETAPETICKAALLAVMEL